MQRQHLEDIFTNILVDAREALFGQGEIRIAVRRGTGGSVEITIADNGAGMTQATLSRACEPFFTTKPSGEGTGLGLYICKQIIDQCQGTIKVETVLGQGTCFRVNLPVRTQKQ